MPARTTLLLASAMPGPERGPARAPFLLWSRTSMRWLKFFFPLLSLVGCAGFKETTTPAGNTNLVNFAPSMWRMGQPPTAAAWKELSGIIAPHGEPVVVFKLNDDVEGSDDPATTLPGWTVEKFAMPPEDDKPWTIVEKPSVDVVRGVVAAILFARAHGYVVVWHCSHGRDRTSLVSALVGEKMFGWTKDQMASDMMKHGFRWVDVDLSEYFVLDVK